MTAVSSPLQEFLDYDSSADIDAFVHRSAEQWIAAGEQRALETFRTAAASVPAYRSFLSTHNVDAGRIQTIDDFRQVPMTDKESYFESYPLPTRTVAQALSSATAIHYSSGSSGRAHYWPKSALQDINAYKGLELLYVTYFAIDQTPTLLVNCFGMGAWTAGEMVHTSAKIMGEKGLRLSVISPGLSVQQFFDVLSDLGGHFEQLIVAGYPSFLSDLVDQARARGIDLARFNVKILTGGEKYSESWRERMAAAFGLRQPHRSIASVLGTSETGVTSTSTPFTDLLRMYLHAHSDPRTALFGDAELPSITQFVPPARYVETVDGEIVVTCMGMVPLVRYRTHDRGSILDLAELRRVLPASFWSEYQERESGTPAPWQLPVLTIDGRYDALIVRGANVYHDQIATVLEAPALASLLTGRFHARTAESAGGAVTWELNLEMKRGNAATDAMMVEIRDTVVSRLVALNAEYADVSRTARGDVAPHVRLTPYGTDGFLAGSGKVAAAPAARPSGVIDEHPI